MKIGIAIPNYNRESELLRSFEQVYQDSRVEQITIADDASRLDLTARLRQSLKPLGKVYFHRYEDNIGCYLNKARALQTADAELPWQLLLDSDNAVSHRALDALQDEYPWNRDTLYMPSWAMPVHDYRAFEGQSFTKKTIAPMVDAPRFLTALNTGNFFVHREAFSEVFDAYANPLAADSLFFVYCWLNVGRTIKFVPGFYYDHQVSSRDSNYNRYAMQSQQIFASLSNELRMMR